MNGAKRAVPQPGELQSIIGQARKGASADVFAAAIPEPKRKPLAQQAGEYPTKAAPARNTVQGVSLVGAGTGVSALSL